MKTIDDAEASRENQSRYSSLRVVQRRVRGLKKEILDAKIECAYSFVRDGRRSSNMYRRHLFRAFPICARRG